MIINKSVKSEFSEKYSLYGEMLYKIAFLYLGNSYDAEDVLQEVFIKLLYGNQSFKSPEHEKAWLIRVTQNKCRDALKSAGRKNTSLVFDNSDFSLGFCENKSDIHMDILNKILQLPNKYKTAVILYYYYDYSVRDVAAALKISNSAAKMRLKRAREILKIELEEYNL